MIAQAIEWKLTQLNKFDNAKVKTIDGVIVLWEVDGVDAPDQATLDLWRDEYDVAKVANENSKRNRKHQLLDALATLTGLTRKQVLKCLMEIVQDGNDD